MTVIKFYLFFYIMKLNYYASIRCKALFWQEGAEVSATHTDLLSEMESPWGWVWL